MVAYASSQAAWGGTGPMLVYLAISAIAFGALPCGRSSCSVPPNVVFHITFLGDKLGPAVLFSPGQVHGKGQVFERASLISGIQDCRSYRASLRAIGGAPAARSLIQTV